MDTLEEHAKVVREAGFRVTKSRLAVMKVLVQAEESLDAAAIHRRGQEVHPALGRVSVYRALELLVGLGLVRHVHGEGKCHGYAWADRPEGHYLICRTCGQVQEFPCVGFGELLDTVGREYGFQIQQHMLQLEGLCKYCQ